MTIKALLNTTALGLVLFATGCQTYFDRRDTIESYSGEANAVNEAKMVVDPWPRNVDNVDIPGDGQRLGDAVERYKGANSPESANGEATLLLPVAPGTETN